MKVDISFNLSVVALLVWSASVLAVPISPSSGGVNFARVDIGYSGTTNPNYGIVQVDIPVVASILGNSTGYVNVTDSSGEWIVQNIPVADGYGYPGISTMVNLTGFSGPNMQLYAEVTSDPLHVAPSGPTSTFSLSPTNVSYNAQGKGPGNAVQPNPSNVPNPNLVSFTAPTALNTFGIWQRGHSSVEQDINQCGPASVANSLDWLRSTYGDEAPLNPVLQNIPGISGVPANSLVGKLDVSMGRSAGQTVSDGQFMNGKLSFIDDAANGLKGKLKIKHWPGVDAATNGNQTVGTTVSNDVSGNGGNIVDWIIAELMAGEDVEMSWLWEGGGGHWVDLIGGGKMGGVPWVAWVHDGTQGDNTRGTAWWQGGIGFSTITSGSNLLPTWIGSGDSKATLDLTVSESVPEPSTMFLLVVGILFLWIRKGKSIILMLGEIRAVS